MTTRVEATRVCPYLEEGSSVHVGVRVGEEIFLGSFFRSSTFLIFVGKHKAIGDFKFSSFKINRVFLTIKI